MTFSQTLYPDSPARYFVNGKRVSRDSYEFEVGKAIREGRYSCLTARAFQLGGGKFKRINRACG